MFASLQVACLRFLVLAGLIATTGLAIAGTSVSAQAQTNFGSVNIGSSTTSAVTVTIPSAATLSTISVLTQGVSSLDFTKATGGSCATGTAYAANAICTVEVAFAPKYSGNRYGAVVLESSSGVIGTAYLQGSGTGPQVIFQPGSYNVITSSPWVGPTAHIAVDGGGNLYIANPTNDQAFVSNLSSGSYHQGTIFPNLSNPLGIAVDSSGNVFIAVTGSNQIIEETLFAGAYTQSTVVSGLSTPTSVAVDAADNLYIADQGAGAVYKETLSNGSYSQSVVASGFTNPAGVAVDGNGNVYIADYGTVYAGGTVAPGVFKETPTNGTYVQTSIGSGWKYPAAVTVDGLGNIYVADEWLSVLNKETFGTNGSYTQSAVAASPYTQAWSPNSVAVDGAGNLFIADSNGQQIFKEDRADPPAIDFITWTAPGTTDPNGPITSAVFNAGNATLNFTAVAYPTDFPEATGTSNDCTASSVLTTEESCNLTINFSPLARMSIGSQATELSENVSITTNTLNAPGTLQAVSVSGYEEMIIPTLTVTPSSLTLTTAQAISATVVVSGGSGLPVPTGVVLVSGGNNFSSGDVNLVNGQAVINIPAGALSVGTYPLAADYPYGNLTYDNAVGTSSPLTITQAPKTTPSVTVTPSLISITTAQALTVNAIVTPAAGYPTPTGSAALTSSGSTYGTATLSSGSASFTIAAGSMPVGNDTLTVSYTPDTLGAVNFSSATGNSPAVTVTQATKIVPTVTATPSPGTVTSAQSFTLSVTVAGTTGYPTPTGSVSMTGGGYTSSASTLAGGSATIVVPAGALAAGTDALTVSYTPDSAGAANFNAATGSATEIVSNLTPVISSFTPAYVSAGGAAFTLTVNGTGFAANSTVIWGGSALATQFSSANKLFAQVTAAQVATAGIATIAVQTPSPDSSTSNTLQFEVDSVNSGATGPTFTTISATVAPGASVTYALSPPAVTNASVTCLNLPAGASCSYSSATNVLTVLTSSTTPAGTYQITAVFSETVEGAAAAGFLVPILLLPILGLRKKLAAQRVWLSVALGIVVISATVFCLGCGGGGAGSTTVNPTHQATISGSVTLIVQ